MIRIYEDDCFNILPTLESGQFTLIFLDPPYYDWEGMKGQPGYKKPDHNKLSYQCYRLLKGDGVVIICGLLGHMVKEWKYWERFFNYDCEIIWYKTQGGTLPLSRHTPYNVHDCFFFLWKKGHDIHRLKLDFRTKEPEHPKDRTLRLRRLGHGVVYQDAGYIKSIIPRPQIKPREKEYIGHPTQKPLDIMTILINAATDPGDSVLDPFLGSGTTAVACKLLDRNCIGIEINPEYVNLSYKRLREIEQQKALTDFQ